MLKLKKNSCIHGKSFQVCEYHENLAELVGCCRCGSRKPFHQDWKEVNSDFSVGFLFTNARESEKRLIIIQKAPLIDKIINGNLDLKKY